MFSSWRLAAVLLNYRSLHWIGPQWVGNPLVSLLLTHWGRVMHLCISKLTSIASDNGLSPRRHQAIIWNSAGISLIGPLGTNFSEISIEIHTFSLKKICLKMSSAKCRPFCLGLNGFVFSQQWFVSLCVLSLYRRLLLWTSNKTWAPLWSSAIRKIHVYVKSNNPLCHPMSSVMVVLTG